MLYRTVIREKCKFCGEMIDSGINRCPYCCSLLHQKTKSENKLSSAAVTNKPMVVMGDNFIMKIDHAYSNNNSKDNFIENNNPKEDDKGKKEISNGLKVFLIIISVILPGIGQLIGLIMGITYSNSQSKVKKSISTVLKATSIIMFIFWSVLIFLAMVLLSSTP